MNENGRKVDFLIEDEIYTDPRTGMQLPSNYFVVWADEGMKTVIQSVEGVTNVYNSLSKTKFDVYIDGRYDRETIKQEIAAAIRNNL